MEHNGPSDDVDMIEHELFCNEIFEKPVPVAIAQIKSFDKVPTLPSSREEVPDQSEKVRCMYKLFNQYLFYWTS